MFWRLALAAFAPQFVQILVPEVGCRSFVRRSLSAWVLDSRWGPLFLFLLWFCPVVFLLGSRRRKNNIRQGGGTGVGWLVGLAGLGNEEEEWEEEGRAGLFG